MKFRKKPVIVEAFQFGTAMDCPIWFMKEHRNGNIYIGEDFCYIRTLEGKMTE